jgi:hypothetical protein
VHWLGDTANEYSPSSIPGISGGQVFDPVWSTGFVAPSAFTPASATANETTPAPVGALGALDAFVIPAAPGATTPGTLAVYFEFSMAGRPANYPLTPSESIDRAYAWEVTQQFGMRCRADLPQSWLSRYTVQVLFDDLSGVFFEMAHALALSTGAPVSSSNTLLSGSIPRVDAATDSFSVTR